mmetsp:Transcript_128215/g.285691  ORF Transcript_128215/g.285691 Transcript_128215/m.285691 type:complete len:293 (-) Transcript_128215:759-1637(-)
MHLIRRRPRMPHLTTSRPTSIRNGAMMDRPAELAFEVAGKVALRLLKVVAARQCRVVLFEQHLDPVHALCTLHRVPLTVPERAADAGVGLELVLPLALVEEGLDVLDTRELVQANRSCFLDAVGAIPLPSRIVAAAAWHPALAFFALLLEVTARARPWQGVPDRSMTVQAAASMPHCCLGRRLVAGNTDILMLTSHDEANLLPNPIALRHRATAIVEGHEAAELSSVHIVEFPGGRHGDLEALDPGDVVLPVRREGRDDLVVEVPHHPSEVSCVDVLQVIIIIALGAVHIED